MNLAGGEKRKERLVDRVVGCGITGEERLGVVQVVPHCFRERAEGN